ncbi:hypothetical protein BT96DRAFT_1024212 [Gymnopus androsaceus JB14]|uniref:Uncharacterized protein n=1 Tax=Gymnopus androsaceus JB14 TaxID=1447944 RepID=A0A6A4H089_9AGAR|nr:hypothetical protein BT96DRAFT_1024212 [Gymnopus androsaceus JB14]
MLTQSQIQIWAKEPPITAIKKLIGVLEEYPNRVPDPDLTVLLPYVCLLLPALTVLDTPFTAILLYIGGGTVAAAALTPLLGPVILGAAGFQAGGIAAGSLAAGVQAGIGNVVAGSAFAGAQAAGATGLIPVIGHLIGAGVGVGVGAMMGAARR